MNNILVLYKSKYGSSARYASWLKDRLKCDASPAESFKHSFDPYEIILLIGGIYAGGIAGLKFLKKHQELLSGKKILIFAVGAAPYDEGALKKLKEQNLSKLSIPADCFMAAVCMMKKR